MRNIEVECNITIFSPYPQCGKSFLLPGPAPCLRLRFRCFLVPGLWYLIHATDVSCSPGFVCLFLVTFTVLALVTFTFTFVRSGMFMVMVPWFWLRYITLFHFPFSYGSVRYLVPADDPFHGLFHLCCFLFEISLRAAPFLGCVAG